MNPKIDLRLTAPNFSARIDGRAENWYNNVTITTTGGTRGQSSLHLRIDGRAENWYNNVAITSTGGIRRWSPRPFMDSLVDSK